MRNGVPRTLEERKALNDAFSQVGEDADVGFALSAQQEVIGNNNLPVSKAKTVRRKIGKSGSKPI